MRTADGPSSRTADPAAPRAWRDAVAAALRASSWRTCAPPADPPPGVEFALFATRPERGGRKSAILVHGFERPREVRLSDLWALVAQVNSSGADHGALFLGRDVLLSGPAADTAALLQIRVFRPAA